MHGINEEKSALAKKKDLDEPSPFLEACCGEER
jgi:hypothetical protein